MKIIRTKDYEHMSRVAAMFLLGEALKGYGRKTNISVTGGKTPVRMYEIICDFLKENPIPYTEYFNFDDIPLRGREEGVTMHDLRKLFFEPCGIAEEKIHIFGMQNYENYDELIEASGGLDMIMLGLGPDGHFCGNLSGTLEQFDNGCRTVSNNLNQKLHDRVAFLCGGEENMTEYYVTFGPKTVMNAKKVVMIVSGKEKAAILKRVIEGKMTVDVPSTILMLHPDMTIIADEDALSECFAISSAKE